MLLTHTIWPYNIRVLQTMETITFCDLRFHLQHKIINVTNKVTNIMNPTDAQVVKWVNSGMASFFMSSISFTVLQCDGRRRISFSIVWFTRYIYRVHYLILYRNVYAKGDIYCILMIWCVIFLEHQFFWSHPRVLIMSKPFWISFVTRTSIRRICFTN